MYAMVFNTDHTCVMTTDPDKVLSSSPGRRSPRPQVAVWVTQISIAPSGQCPQIPILPQVAAHTTGLYRTLSGNRSHRFQHRPSSSYFRASVKDLDLDISLGQDITLNSGGQQAIHISLSSAPSPLQISPSSQCLNHSTSPPLSLLFPHPVLVQNNGSWYQKGSWLGYSWCLVESMPVQVARLGAELFLFFSHMPDIEITDGSWYDSTRLLCARLEGTLGWLWPSWGKPSLCSTGSGLESLHAFLLADIQAKTTSENNWWYISYKGKLKHL